jgi:hypothetical protein
VQYKRFINRVGTKVFAFIFSRKFSRNSNFVFAKDSVRKDETFAKVFAKTKFFDFAKTEGGKSLNGNFCLFVLLKMLRRSLSGVKMTWYFNKVP